MMRSLFSGVAGLKTHQQKMDVIGNNIANVNTTAFKSTSTTFQDVMYQTMSNASGGSNTRGGVNARQIGLGVTTAANKVSITTQGASEATGDGLDLRLVDKQSTNFFIVSDGTSNMFTRAGSFYVDGNGNLAMTSTGYLVMGWQVDPATKAIKRDTVSPLKVMGADNQTSDPEYTTQAHASGIIDANDSNVTSTSGHAMNLTFYDNLGYAYTAKFSVKSGEDKAEDGSPITSGSSTNKAYNGFTIELDSITSDSNVDSEGNPIDLLDKYIQDNLNTVSGSGVPSTTEGKKRYLKAQLFGNVGGKQVDSFKIDSSQYTVEKEGNTTYISKGSGQNKTRVALASVTAALNNSGPNGEVVFTNVSTSATSAVEVSKIFSGLSAAASNYTTASTRAAGAGASTTTRELNKDIGFNASFDENSESLKIQTDAASYDLFFKSSDGTFSDIDTRNGATGTAAKFNNLGTAAKFNVNLLGDQFNTDGINIDFTSLLNYDNGGKSTAALDRGTTADASDGAGKKIGQITGLSIQDDGQIFASYSNGNTELLGQIPVARFANASGLESLGDNCYQTTLNSGSFDGIGVDISADGSKMNSGYLEMSNVDLAQEFTQMITTQRGFQANSRIITVSDTMLEELTNLKR
ncbi:MAG: flagellar hook-basal body complex protein [Lachnospiraceae bacterium]|nr:flagellar hook-basal body complex protein [Lachnospiraceae bacterium]